MKYKILSVLFLFIFICFAIQAQLDEHPRVGIGAGGSSGVNEAKTWPFNLSGRLFIRTPVYKMFHAELDGNYLINSGKTWRSSYNIGTGTYKTTLIPVNFKAIFAPVSNETWLPYAMISLGGLYFNVDDKSPDAVRMARSNGWTSSYGLGAGLEKMLSNRLSIDFQLSANQSFTDDINGERDNIYDGYWNVFLSIAYFPFSSGDKDSDKDGLSDEMERKLGTNPKNSDTDGDGLGDGEEYNKYKTNNLRPDTDLDSLGDGDEVKAYNTDPLKTDTDEDGLPDGDEVLIYKTDPMNPDTDGDGLKDGAEVLTHKTKPLVPDTDGDGLKDGDEVRLYQTNPLSTKTDDDELKDGEEVITYKTNPKKPDTDDDGLKDHEEVFIYKTNPLNKDSDGGSVDDGTEIKRGTNPLDPNDDVPVAKQTLKTEVGSSIVLEGIIFESGKSRILPQSEPMLQKALNTMAENPDLEVEIQGHTDNAGNRAKNMKLSLDRAESVKIWLVGKGIKSDRITTKGLGPDKPLVPNDSPENMQKNRRIEFLRIK